METTVEMLNKIANKLGDENADQYTTVAQALGSIANALGNADPDKIQTVPEALQEILAVAGGGGGTPKAFGVDLLQISVPFGEYNLNEKIMGGQVNACAIPSLDQFSSQLQEISSWASGGYCGFGMIMDESREHIYNDQAILQAQGGMLMLLLNDQVDVFLVWDNGKAYLVSPKYDYAKNGWEFYLYKEDPLA